MRCHDARVGGNQRVCAARRGVLATMHVNENRDGPEAILRVIPDTEEEIQRPELEDTLKRRVGRCLARTGGRTEDSWAANASAGATVPPRFRSLPLRLYHQFILYNA